MHRPSRAEGTFVAGGFYDRWRAMIQMRHLVRTTLVLALITVGCSSASESSQATARPPSSSTSPTIATSTTDSAATGVTTTVPAEATGKGTGQLQAIADAAGDALIFVSDEGGVFTAVSGHGDTGVAIEPDAAFFLGSGSKMITAATILRLVDQGLVGLDDLLADYVDFEVATPITIRHLLQHTSGLSDDNSIYDTCDPDEVMDGLAAQAIGPYNREPGQRAGYSTNGFNMLSLVMSAATGQSAADVVRENIFEPLAMTSSFFTGAEDGPVLVVGETSWDPECAAERMDIGTGGGFASSAVDLDIFMRALFDGDLLTAESLDEMMTVGSQVYGFDYGLGLGALYPPGRDDHPMYGHWGTYGWEAGALYDPDTHRTVVVLGRNFLPTVWEAVAWAESDYQ